METPKNIKEIEALEVISDGIYNMESNLRNQRYALISAAIRALGEKEENGDISIKLTDNYRGAGVRISNKWTPVNYLCLRHTDGEDMTENYEVYFKYVYNGKEVELIDTDDYFSEWSCDIISGTETFYEGGARGIHDFLESLMLVTIGRADKEKEASAEQEVLK